jgi:hypothetical protein
MKFAPGIAIACALLGGCSTAFGDTGREVAIISEPPGAACVVEHEGEAIAAIPATPAKIDLPLNINTVTVRCNKQGYSEGRYLGQSGNIATAAAHVAGGAVADLIQSAGLSSILDPQRIRYDDAIYVGLTPLPDLSNVAYQAPTSLFTPMTIREARRRGH